jgi:hypothetical protein
VLLMVAIPTGGVLMLKAAGNTLKRVAFFLRRFKQADEVVEHAAELGLKRMYAANREELRLLAGDAAVEALERVPAGRAGKPEGKLSLEIEARTAEQVQKAHGEGYHYTFSEAIPSIESQGLRPGSYATTTETLTPLQAQIDLALPPNRGLPGAIIRIDLAGLRQAGYQIPEVRQVARSFGMPGGGFEMQFPYEIPPQFIKVVRP